MNSRICRGTVRHRRFVDKVNQFSYKVFMMYLDLDELDYVFEDYWLWSIEKFNVASFKRMKFLKDKQGPLGDAVKALIKRETNNNIDKVFLLTNLAYFGYCFNPISVYFCLYEGKLKNFVVEVTNTPWGEMHQYVLTPEMIKKNIYTAKFKKLLHVSPFLNMDYEYHLRCKYAKDAIIVEIENWQNNKRHFDATLKLIPYAINHYNLANTLLRFPFMTGKVILAIHWQALKLWLKRVKVIEDEKKNER